MFICNVINDYIRNISLLSIFSHLWAIILISNMLGNLNLLFFKILNKLNKTSLVSLSKIFKIFSIKIKIHFRKNLIMEFIHNSNSYCLRRIKNFCTLIRTIFNISEYCFIYESFRVNLIILLIIQLYIYISIFIF